MENWVYPVATGYKYPVCTQLRISMDLNEFSISFGSAANSRASTHVRIFCTIYIFMKVSGCQQWRTGYCEYPARTGYNWVQVPSSATVSLRVK